MMRGILNTLSMLFAFACVMLFVAAAAFWFSDRMSETFAAPMQRLIYQTDHAAVLRACREVIANPQAAGFPPAKNGSTDIEGTQRGTPPAELPEVLHKLDFASMTVEGDRATILFGGGHGRWGYRTYSAEDDTQLELIPGLWFWMDRGGRLPRDPSKVPYYLASKLLAIGGTVSLGLAIVLLMSARRRSMASKSVAT